MGWWSRLFGRGAAAAPPSRALPAPAAAEPEPPEPEPEPAVPEPESPEPEPEPAVPEPEPAPVREAGDISPARLDAALQRLRAEHPETPESQAPGDA